jgi:hypothetical protein
MSAGFLISMVVVGEQLPAPSIISPREAPSRIPGPVAVVASDAW